MTFHANFIWVIAGCALIGAGASLAGNFAFLRKRSLIGDAVAHALLPGVVIGYLISGEKSLWMLFPGALAAGWLSLLTIEGITAFSKLKSDTAIASVLSVFFAAGIVLLTYVQQMPEGNHAGLDAFLFGKAAAMLPGDLYLFAAVDAVLVGVIWLLYPYLKLFCFDPEFAAASGLPMRALSFILSTLTVLAVAAGIQAVGVVLMAALLITPAAAGRYLSKRLSGMIAVSVVLGTLSAVLGAAVSYSAPAMPTGPWIVVTVTFFAVFAFLFAPEKGLFPLMLRKKRVVSSNAGKESTATPSGSEHNRLKIRGEKPTRHE